MKQILFSAFELGAGVLRRFYWWLFAFLLDPWDVYEKFIRDRLPTPYRLQDLPSKPFPYVLTAGLVVAMVLAYHELRIGKLRAETSARAQRAATGAIRKLSRLRSFGITRLFANHVGDEEFIRSWRPRHERWKRAVERHIRGHFGPTLGDRFRDLGQLEGKRYVPNSEYNRHMNTLAKELAILEQVLDAHAIQPARVARV